MERLLLNYGLEKGQEIVHLQSALRFQIKHSAFGIKKFTLFKKKVVIQKMIIENVFIPDDEKNMLKKLIGKRIKTISALDESDFEYDFVWTLYIQCEDLNIKIDREDIVAKLENIIEDGGLFKIYEPTEIEECDSTKTINRVVKGVSLVIDTVEIEESNYRITYPQAIIIHFDDCNLLIEKRWLFSLAGFVVRLEPLDAENFGLYDESFFWYDPDEDEEPPKFVQTVAQL